MTLKFLFSKCVERNRCGNALSKPGIQMLNKSQFSIASGCIITHEYPQPTPSPTRPHPSLAAIHPVDVVKLREARCFVTIMSIPNSPCIVLGGFHCFSSVENKCPWAFEGWKFSITRDRKLCPLPLHFASKSLMLI